MKFVVPITVQIEVVVKNDDVGGDSDMGRSVADAVAAVICTEIMSLKLAPDGPVKLLMAEQEYPVHMSDEDV